MEEARQPASYIGWPHGLQGHLAWFGARIAAAGLLALWRYRVGVVAVIAASAAGPLYRLVLQPLSI